VSRGKREDLSGPAVLAFCRGLGWEIVTTLRVSDDLAASREQLCELADSGRLDLVLTTGGTGIGPRDNTPEATQAVADRVIPGIAEEMRRKGLEKTPTAVLSRAVAVSRGKTLIVNLPGSPKGATESIEAVAHLLPHAVHVLHGASHD
jgi:molybdenum cofactor synthesis domain-containing protein